MKLVQNNLIITKADKGDTLVIIQKDDYYQKIDEFITENQFIKIENNYTKKNIILLKLLTIHKCKTIIKSTDKWKYQIMNPETPQIYGAIKLHEHNKPIRPIINWKNCPGYKLATFE
jgi:hypothetical protein